MSLVGIIANPAAGKDVRRLVAHASFLQLSQNFSKSAVVARQCGEGFRGAGPLGVLRKIRFVQPQQRIRRHAIRPEHIGQRAPGP